MGKGEEQGAIESGPCTSKSWKVLVPMVMEATRPSSGRVSWLPAYITWQDPAYSARPWLP